MTDRIGQKLGNYHLVRLLGEGGFAEVYLGEHIHLGTRAAIKILHTQLTADDVDTFRNEARTIAQLEHPHIVRVLDFGVEGKTPFLVMSYATNGTLRQCHPKGTRLTLATTLPIWPPNRFKASRVRPATSIPLASSSTNGFLEPAPFTVHLQKWSVNTSPLLHHPCEKSCQPYHLLLRK